MNGRPKRGEVVDGVGGGLIANLGFSNNRLTVLKVDRSVAVYSTMFSVNLFPLSRANNKSLDTHRT